MIETDPHRIWDEYRSLKALDDSRGLSFSLKQARDFFADRQWEGVNAPDLEKPVFNLIKRTVNHCIAMIVSDDLTVKAESYRSGRGKEERELLILREELTRIVEETGFQPKNRQLLKDSAVDGDAHYYIYFDPHKETGQDARGGIMMEQPDMQNVLYGDPESRDIQRQPYLILVSRRPADEVEKEANRWGGDAACVPPGGDRVTVLLKMWKEGGTVRMTKSTSRGAVRTPWDTGYSLYPLTCMTWEQDRSSCRGLSMVSGIIPNQIYLNKLYAMAMKSVKSTAFPKIVYNRSLVPEWTNEVGAAVPVMGNPNEAVAAAQGAGDMSKQVMELIASVMNDTKSLLGATDAALGDVKPENTSAIIALQKAAVAPLELQRLAFYQMAEDCVRIFADIICTDYGLRSVPSAEGDTLFDFAQLRGLRYRLQVEVGESAYWSELMQVRTLDNLYAKGILTAADYVKAMPSRYIPGKEELLLRLEQRGQETQNKEARKEPEGGINDENGNG